MMEIASCLMKQEKLHDSDRLILFLQINTIKQNKFVWHWTLL